ncbi:MAG: DUF169 domain-containing protein [Thermodesulfovibrionales bacterium]
MMNYDEMQDCAEGAVGLMTPPENVLPERLDGAAAAVKPMTMKYDEMQDFFERTLKLITPPVAVAFVRPDDERPKGLTANIKPMTFCQAVTVARQGEYSLYLEKETLSCFNARTTLGLGTAEDLQRDIEKSIETTIGKYAPNREIATKIVMSKFRIPAGSLKGLAVAPLGKARFTPDCLIFTVFPWQAYYLTNAYLWMTGDIPLSFEVATNSLICGYGAGIAGWKKKINCCTACTGGRSYAGTESTEMYWAMPWELADTIIEGLKGRSKKSPYPGLINIPLPAPAPEKHFFRTKA